MAHKPADFANWPKSKRRSWAKRWWKINALGQVEDYTKTPRGPKNTAAANNSVVTYNQPEPESGPGTSVCDEAEPCGVERE